MRKKISSVQSPGAAGVSAKLAAAGALKDQPSASLINRWSAHLRPSIIWIPVALALLGSAVTLANDFACDDGPQVVNNLLIKSLANLPADFTASAWRYALSDITGISQSYYRPLFSAWLTISNALFGTSAWGWHLMTLLLHAAATGLAFVVIKDLFNRPALALIAASLFAVLPVHAEAVAWVSGSTFVLMAFGLLAALRFYLRHRETGQTPQLALALACYLLALWSNEAALAFPLVVAYLELTHFRESPEGKERRALLAGIVTGLVLVTAAYVLMRYLANGALVTADETRLPLGTALLAIPLAIARYLALLAWPFGYSYLHYITLVSSVLSGSLLVPLALILALGFVVARYGTRELRFAGAWFILTLAPVLVVMNRLDIEHLVQERYLYLPSLGFCLALGVGIESLARRVRWRWAPSRLATALVAALVVFYSVAYILHSRHWNNSLTVYRQAIAVAPSSAAAHSELAVELANAGRVHEAASYAYRAIELDPQYAGGYLKLAYLMQQQGAVNKAIETLEQAKAAVGVSAINRTSMATLNLNLGMLYSQKKDFARALANANESLAMWPRATACYYTALIYASAKQPEDALPLYQEAQRRLPPTYAPIHMSLGDIYGQLGQREEARAEFVKFLSLAPPDTQEASNVRDLLKRLDSQQQTPGAGKPQRGQ
jgi:protein O-mannosyl-transferase